MPLSQDDPAAFTGTAATAKTDLFELDLSAFENSLKPIAMVEGPTTALTCMSRWFMGPFHRQSYRNGV